MTSLVTLPAAREFDSGTSDEEHYVGYSYSYPHKSAYGALEPAVPLAPLWQGERRDPLFLYFHVPFCEMRCGFCNLFARAGGTEDTVDAYLDTLDRQARFMAEATAGARAFARCAIGGGTPTYLTAAQLDRLFDVAARCFGVVSTRIPTSVETSPGTADAERLRVLLQRGVERVSLGVQSFVEDETHALGRPQSTTEVNAALERLRAFPVLNIDLIYGQPGQTQERWRFSLREALRWRPEELYLYPLYVRPGTGLGRRGDGARLPDSTMLGLYRTARDLLLGEGYEQVSMRFFRKPRAAAEDGPVYCCQSDGMLGLGCGARSYTSQLHYSSRFAVDSAGVRAILDNWIRQDDAQLQCATWGCWLSDDDRRRRFLLQSLLTRDGVGSEAFAARFGVDLHDAFPGLGRWLEADWLTASGGSVRLTPLGMERSDALGPAIYSSARRSALRSFALR